MSFTQDGRLDVDEALRMFDTAIGDERVGGDLVLLLENKGAVIEGESSRKFEDGKKRLELLGFHVGAQVVTPPGGASKGRVQLGTLTLVRYADAASASVGSLMISQSIEAKLVLSSFKAGGDDSADAQPTLELTFEQARCEAHELLTVQRFVQPCELAIFSYRSMTIASAPQQSGGLRGAVRTCQYTA